MKVFISGREGELDDERAMAVEVIQSFHLILFASENRPASEQSIEDEYLGEVIDADIYVGIFGKEYSEPTRKEFDTARANNIPPLVFIKILKNDERDEKLTDFLKEIRAGASGVRGVTTKDYNNVIDFREHLTDALSVLLSRRFRKAQELEKSRDRLPKEEKHKSPIPGVSFEPSKEVTFLTFKMPDKIERGKPIDVSAAISGSTSNGFLDLATVDPDGRIKWYPDPKSWNSALDLGRLKFTGETYSNIWGFTVSDRRKPGTYKAIMGVYEDTPDLEKKKRKLIAFQETEFEVV